MATRLEHKLMRRAELNTDGVITFKPVKVLPVDTAPPASAWLRLLMAEDDSNLVACAGLFGSIHGRDTLDAWRAVRRDLWRLITAHVGYYVDPDDVFENWAPQPEVGYAGEVNALIVSGDIRLTSATPLAVTGENGRGKALAQAINEMQSAKHLLWCKHCRRPFAHFSARPTSFCGVACRKADHYEKDRENG